MCDENPWTIGQEHTAPDGTKLRVCDCETDGSGCKVCDGCWYLKHSEYECPNCRGPFAFIDAIWGVTFQEKDEVRPPINEM